MDINIRALEAQDLAAAVAIWNQVVDDGAAFPQMEPLTEESGQQFFAGQSFTGIAIGEDGAVLGLYILHPNNVGRCGHICNASYAVHTGARGRHVGEAPLPSKGPGAGLSYPPVQRRSGQQHPGPPPLREVGLHPLRHHPRRLSDEGRSL